jgi:hypothetical protein
LVSAATFVFRLRVLAMSVSSFVPTDQGLAACAGSE